MRRIKKMCSLIVIFSLPCVAFASQTAVYSWEKVLSKISDSLTGPVAYSLSLIAIVACGLTMAFAFTRWCQKKFVQVACGMSLAIFAAQIVTNFLSFTGAVV